MFLILKNMNSAFNLAIILKINHKFSVTNLRIFKKSYR